MKMGKDKTHERTEGYNKTSRRRSRNSGINNKREKYILDHKNNKWNWEEHES